MKVVDIIHPNIITVNYKELGNAECKCLWAKFNIDLDNYSISIKSECGNYSHKWDTIPDEETFIHFCCRFNKEYLLSKFADKKILSNQKTWNNIENIIKSKDIKISKTNFEYLRNICMNQMSINDMYISLYNELEYLGIDKYFQDGVLYNIIEYDYPNKVKTVVDIFLNDVVPKLKTYKGAE